MYVSGCMYICVHAMYGRHGTYQATSVRDYIPVSAVVVEGLRGHINDGLVFGYISIIICTSARGVSSRQGDLGAGVSSSLCRRERAYQRGK